MRSRSYLTFPPAKLMHSTEAYVQFLDCRCIRAPLDDAGLAVALELVGAVWAVGLLAPAACAANAAFNFFCNSSTVRCKRSASHSRHQRLPHTLVPNDPAHHLSPTRPLRRVLAAGPLGFLLAQLALLEERGQVDSLQVCLAP